jgi:hypothetical protein
VYEDGTVVDHTRDVNNMVEYDMLINAEWLELATNAKNVTWKFLDPKTLEETVFPSAGFVIDDPFQQESQESTE